MTGDFSSFALWKTGSRGPNNLDVQRITADFQSVKAKKLEDVTSLLKHTAQYVRNCPFYQTMQLAGSEDGSDIDEYE